MTVSVALAGELHLRNGLTVSVKPVTRDDEASIFEFLSGLSADSRRLRFFSAAIDLRREAHRGAAGDDVGHHGILALARGRGVVGHAIYVRAAHSERAEVAVEVADDVHHLGLATLLIIRLAKFAEERQITRFFAEVLPENRDMLAVFRDGFMAATVNVRDEVDVEFPTSSWRAAHAQFER
ncbi:MAG: GNAT family N-acetyltransferase [Solirubrobacteraceae bacterium]